MNFIKSLSSKKIIYFSSLALLSIAMSLLLFGDNSKIMQNESLKQAQGSIKADMLYIHPSHH